MASGRKARTARALLGALASACSLAAVLAILAISLGPLTGRYRTMTVLTASMRPGLPVGTLVVAVPVPTNEIRVGDVITYAAPTPDAPVVTHRVTKVRTVDGATAVHTKGDANAAADPWEARLEGPVAWKMRSAVPHAGRAIMWLHSEGAQVVFRTVVPVLIVLSALRSIWRRKPARSALEGVAA